MTITLRNTKGSALTFNELDGNFTDLNSQIEGLPDSAQVIGLIDENALDSGRAIRLIDSNYISDRVDSDKFMSIPELKSEVAASADFAAFKSRIAAL